MRLKKIIAGVLVSFAVISAYPCAFAETEDNISISADLSGYHLDDGVFSLDLKQNGKQIFILYKDGKLVSSAMGKGINIADKDFDTLKVMLWSDLDSMRPIRESAVFSYEDVMSAPEKEAVEPQYGDIPNIYLTGSTAGMTKTNNVTLKMQYESATEKFDGYVSIKWQGSSALRYPKKNFAIKLYKDELLDKKLKVTFKDWDRSNNYVLKANYIDATSARNIVSARLYQKLPDTYLSKGAQGVVDGFPVRLYINDEFYGLYTWNKPKKGWVFGMNGDDPNELLYFSNAAEGSGLFRQKFSEDESWELVYPDEHEDSTEFDRVTGFIAECSDEDFKEHIEEYMDLNSLLNYYVFSQVILNYDGFGKNMNMATYDGKIWYIRPYDLDATYGLFWWGSYLKAYNTDMSKDFMRKSSLWAKLEDNFPQEIYDRYVLLRNDQLSEGSILAEFKGFMDEVGEDLYAENIERWPDIPGQSFMYDQIEEFVNARYKYLDTYMERFNMNKTNQ